ncbi:MAG: sugar ABC transporter permease [Elusimicrobia bacterium RIFCSPLOWO2_01_FULL_54_10]|nr:MAG: sugar ABC transporter permease [Elusimicrobia bacterium RIFCSPLOWO2_01_FULL_54_10]
MVLTLFLFIPILASFLISLTDWNIYSLADRGRLNFVGFKNYMDVVHDQVFWKSLWNTLFFTAVGVPFTIMISLLCAVVLNEKFVRWKTFFRTAFFLPVISTIVAVAVVWRWIYNPEYGLLNWFMKSVGLPEFNWLSDPSTALASLILMAAWKNFGYNMVIFLAGLQSIPEALYESARIDGANVWQLFLHVTLPGLRTTTVFVAVMSTIGYLQFFAEPYVMTNKGGPLNSTMSIVLYMYNQGFKFFQLGYASALAYILFGIIFAFTFLQIRLRKSGFETPV